MDKNYQLLPQNDVTSNNADAVLRMRLQIHRLGVPTSILKTIYVGPHDDSYNNRDGNGETVAHIAARNPQQTEVIKYLIEKNVDFTIKNNNGRTPFEVAQQYNAVDIIALLNQHNITE